MLAGRRGRGTIEPPDRDGHNRRDDHPDRQRPAKRPAYRGIIARVSIGIGLIGWPRTHALGLAREFRERQWNSTEIALAPVGRAHPATAPDGPRAVPARSGLDAAILILAPAENFVGNFVANFVEKSEESPSNSTKFPTKFPTKVAEIGIMRIAVAQAGLNVGTATSASGSQNQPDGSRSVRTGRFHRATSRG